MNSNKTFSIHNTRLSRTAMVLLIAVVLLLMQSSSSFAQGTIDVASDLIATAISPSEINVQWDIESSSVGGQQSAGFDPVQLVWFYKPASNGSAATLAENFDTYILTRGDETTRDAIDPLSAVTTQYIRFDAIHDPCNQVVGSNPTCSCNTQPWRNNVAFYPNDLCAIRNTHPEWFLRDASGRPIRTGDGFILMDPGNQGWREFWLVRTIQLQEQYGWNGVFLDNVPATRAHARTTLRDYPTDAAYQTAVSGFLQYMYTSYFQPEGRPLYGNIIFLAYNGTNVWFDYLNYMDGAMEEGWAVDWYTGYYSGNQWEEHMSRAERTQAQGDVAILISQGQQNSTQRQAFSFASYMLITNGDASFRYTDADEYAEIWLYPNYELDLGAPLGPRYRDGAWWRRNFTNGRVSVNPTSHQSSFELYDDTTFEPTSFEVQRSTDSGVTFEAVASLPSTATTYDDRGLTPGTEYCYRARTIYASGQSVYTGMDCEMTRLALPSAPNSLNATAVSSSRIDLAWRDLATNETGYEVERSSNNGASFTRVTTLPANSTSYGNTRLNAATEYCYRVRSVNAAGTSSYTVTDCAITHEVLPAAPSGLTATTLSSSQIDVSWNDNADNEANYQLERSTDGGVTFSLFSTRPANSTDYSNGSLTPSRQYCYRVRAINSVGNSSYATPICATTLSLPPTAPTNLAANALSTSRIDLSWRDTAENETGYRVEISEDGGSSFELLTTLPANSESYSSNGLTHTTEYCYRVRAYNIAGTSSYSANSCDTTLSIAPAAPTDLRTDAQSTSRINLSWADNATNETSYLVERSTNNGANYNLLTVLPANTTSYSNSSLNSSTIYCYRVRAINRIGNSAYSFASCDTTFDSVPVSPSNLNAQSVSTSRIDLTWRDNAINETGYQLERSSNNGGSFSLVASLPANATSYANTRLDSGTQYCYRVRAINVVGRSSYSATNCATTEFTVSSAPAGMYAALANGETLQINLSWTDNSTNELGFQLERSSNGGGSYGPIGTLNPNTTYYSDTNVTYETQYCYRVRAYNSAGNSTFVYSNCVTTPEPPVPVCTDPNPGRDLVHSGSYITPGGGVVGVVQNRSQACAYQVGMASYRKFDDIIDNQEIFDSVDGVNVPPGQTINVGVSLPSCAVQVDLFYGGTLHSLNGARYGSRLIDARHIDEDNYCEPPAHLDNDGDGIANSIDDTPNGDTDEDGIDNLTDPTPNGDIDEDGIDDLTDPTPNGDTDGDGIDNLVDTTPNGDTDGDGIDDLTDTTPNGDIDGDGIDDLTDTTPNGDTDGDGIDNLSDTTPNGDIDGDGIDDLTDTTPNGDTDGDGIDNLSDTTPNGDTDGDGIDNLSDTTPNGDTDSDGIDNLSDTTPNGDTDSDGIDNLSDPTPNGDNDGDGIDNLSDPTPNG